MTSLRSLLAPRVHRPRRPRTVILAVTEALEHRVVPSASISAAIDGLSPPVLSLTLPQPTASGSQVVSLTLAQSSADPQLLRDLVIGKHLNKIQITLNDKVKGNFDMITLADALISSFKVVANPKGSATDVISLVGRSAPPGSISTAIDGRTPPVLSLTLPQPTASGSQVVSLTLRQSSADPQFLKDVAIGKLLKNVAIILQKDGNTSIHTITLTDAMISSFKVVTAPNGVVTDTISLVAQKVSID